MAREFLQIGSSREFYGPRKSLSGFFRRVGANDFTAEQLHPRIDQCYTWFFTQGQTGDCLGYCLADECLRKILGNRKNGRRRRFDAAAAIFATRILEWLKHDEDYDCTYRIAIANHASRWVNLVERWSSYRYPGHVQLAGELKPRLQFFFAEQSVVKPVIYSIATPVIRTRQMELF